MEKPREDELTILKRKRIDRLNQYLRVALEKETEESKNPRESDFGREDFVTWSRPSVQIKERIQFLEDSFTRQSIPDNIVGVDGGITKEQFQQNIKKYVFHTNQGGQEVIRCSGQIPSLDGIKLPILFRYGGLNDGGYVNEPKTQEEFNALKTSRSGHSRCNVELSRCGIRILGSVQFPPFAYTINLSDNDITSLNKVKFGRCVEINLARNFISSLRGCRFSEGTSFIELQDNFISRIEDLNIDSLPRTLERIGLAGNPIIDGLTEEQHQALQQEILQRIRTPVRHPPAPSAPPPDPGDEAKPHFEFRGPFFGGSARKTKKTRKPVRKLRRKNQKTNKRRISRNKHKK